MTLLLLALCWVAVPAVAATPDAIVEVTLRAPSGYPSPPAATLEVLSGQARQEVSVPLPGAWRFAGAPQRAVTISARADGLWAAPVVALPPASVEIRFLPAGRMSGRAVVPRGSPLPTSFRLRFGAAKAGSAAGDEVCPVGEAGAFACSVPAGSFDFHLRAEGFVSFFFWDKAVEAGRDADLGGLELVPGNSLTGWLRTEDGKPLDATCAMVLYPAGPELSADARQRLRLNVLELTKRPDGRGFFHFAGVAPGSYDLVARQRGYADAARHDLVVHAGFEARVVGEIVLARPRMATVEVSPPRSADGERWLVSLLRQNREATSNASEKLTDSEGVASFADLPPGRYLAIASAGGKRWATQSFDLTDRDERVALRVGLLHVVGRVELGKEPLGRASVIFGGRTGEVSIEMHSDDAGAFDGFLPRGGDWRIDVSAAKPSVERSLRRVAVARRPGRDYAEVELRLPDSRLQGTVVDEAGKPLERANVRVRPRVADEEEVVADASGGAFDVRGIAVGVVEVEAEAREGLSETVVVSVLPEGITGPLELVVRSLREVKGRVTGPRGAAPGVRVYLRPLGETFSGGDETFSDAQGAFTVKLRRSVREVAAQLMAPGYAMALSRVSIPESGALALSVSEAMGAVALRLPPGLEDSVFGIHSGATAWSGALMGWAQMNPSERHYDRERNELTVPRLEAGVWQFCVATPGSAEWVSIWAWGLPVSECCIEGVVAPGGMISADLTALGTAKPGG